MKIEKNIPIPQKQAEGYMELMSRFEAGDSCLFGAEYKRTFVANFVARANALAKKNKNGKRFSLRKVDGGFRVWRTQ